MSKAILLVAVTLCILGVASAQQLDRNVYVFGTAFEDTGAFKYYYSSRGPIVAGQPISPATVVYPTAQPRVEIVGPMDRFSDGRNWVDFYCASNGLSLKNAHELVKMVPGTGVLTNFAIAGSTANGNLYNSLLPNQNFGAVVGANGLNAQVAKFVTLKNAIPAKVITPKDLFVVSILGGNDVGAILNTLLTQPANVTAHITTFVQSTLASIQSLYDNGARKIVISYADASVFTNVPFVWKASPTGAGLVGAQTIANLMWSSFIPLLNARLTSTMPQLEVELVPLGAIFQSWLNNQELYGIRRPLDSDVGDPRAAPIAHPFPTMYDMSLARPGLVLTNAFYYSDVHLTEHSYKIFADVYSAVTITDLA